MTNQFPPGATIGVMGGGQLGRMFAVAARRMGYRVHVFTPEQNGPAAQFADRATESDYLDESAVRQFANEVDLVTFEFENIPAETIAWVAESRPVRPRGEVLTIAQHRMREKQFLSQNNFPVPEFHGVSNRAELESAIELIGRNAILKTAAFGYDGKGQQAIGSRDLDEIWSVRAGDELILERAIDFEKEVSVIVARDPHGNMKCLPIAENIHRDHVLDVTIVPGGVTASVARDAIGLAEAIAEKLDVIGLLAVEMFVDESGKVLVNELAPRPHNSGHWSIEGCMTSQFEQHVRAVCGLELGAVDQLRPAAMANLLGNVWQNGEPRWANALAIPGVHLHLYGKTEPRPRRKMGHLTALADSTEQAANLVRDAREKLCTPKS